MNIDALNRSAPVRQAGELVEMIPEGQLVLPNNMNNMTVVLSKIKRKGMRDLFINIFIMIAVIYAAYTFYMSDAYVDMLSPSGQVRFIKNFGEILLYLFKVSKFLENKLPVAYNTINAVVPVYSTTLIMNFLRDPNGTIKRYKTLGLKKTNMLSVGGSLAYGVAVNTGVIPGSSIITAGTKVTVSGLEEFIKRSRNMNARQLERAYVTATVVAGVGFVRKYIESLTGQIIRNAIVAATSIVVGQAAQSVTSATMIVSPRRELERRMALVNIPIGQLNNGGRRPNNRLANRPRQN